MTMFWRQLFIRIQSPSRWAGFVIATAFVVLGHPAAVHAADPLCLASDTCSTITIGANTPVPTAHGFTVDITALSPSAGSYSQLAVCLMGATCNKALVSDSVMWLPVTTEAPSASCIGPRCVTGVRLSGLRSGTKYSQVQLAAFKGADAYSVNLGDISTLPDAQPTTATVSNIGPTKATIGWHTTFAGDTYTYISSTAADWSAAMLPISSPDFVVDIVGLPSGTVFGISNLGEILRRDNSGAWTGVMNTAARLQSVDAIDENNAWAVGLGGVIYTIKSGAWVSNSIPGVTTNFYAVNAGTEGTAWVVGQNDTIFFYDGSTWHDRTPPSPRSKRLQTVFSMDNNTVWASGEDGLVYVSSNQALGATWTSVIAQGATAGLDSVTCITSIDGITLWMGDGAGRIWESTNSGQTWPKNSSLGQPNASISNLTIAPDGTLWIAQITDIAHVSPGKAIVVEQPLTKMQLSNFAYVNANDYLVTVNYDLAQWGFNAANANVLSCNPGAYVTDHSCVRDSLGGSPLYYAATSYDAAMTVSAGILGSFPLPPSESNPPSIAFTAPAGAISVSAPAYTVKGTARDNLTPGESGLAAVTLKLNGNPVAGLTTNPVLDANPKTATWQAAVTLIEGTNTLKAIATDASGNVTEANTTIKLDTTPPSLVINAPTNGTVFNALPFTMNGSASDTVGVTRMEYQLNGSRIPVDTLPPGGSGNWSTSVNAGILSGANTIVVTAYDAAGNSISRSVTMTYAAPTFTISVSPAAGSPPGGIYNIGDTPTFNVAINDLNGFNSPVVLTANVGASGMTAKYTPTPVTFPYAGGSVLTLDTSAATAGGPYTITVTATSGSITDTKTVQVSLRAAPTFTITTSPNPPMPDIEAGSSGSYGLMISTNETFADPGVSLSVSGMPAGMTTTFNPGSFVALGASSRDGDHVLQIDTADTTAAGTYSLTVRAVSASLPARNVTVIVNVIPPPSFKVALTPAIATITAGGAQTIYTGTLTSQNGFGGVAGVSVNLSMTVAGDDPRFTPYLEAFNTKPIINVHNGEIASFAITVKALSAMPAGTYPLVVTATGGGKTDTTSVQIVVDPDVTAPVITAVTAIASDVDVTISWQTDEPSDANVAIWLPDNSWSTTGGSADICAATPCIHSVNVAGLTPTTRYYFSVTSVDSSPLKNSTTVSTASDGSQLEFTTKSVPDRTSPTLIVDNPGAAAAPTPVIGRVTISGNAKDNEAVARVDITAVKAGAAKSFSGSQDCGGSDCDFSIDWVTDKTYDNGVYLITVTATDTSDNPTVVTRQVDLENDFNAPSMSNLNVQVADTCGDGGDCWARITWTTATMATSEIRYGTTVDCSGDTGECSYDNGPIYDEKAPDDRLYLTKDHSVYLKGLTANIIYHYQLMTCSGSGVCAY